METEQPVQKSKFKKRLPAIVMVLIVVGVGIGLLLKPVISDSSASKQEAEAAAAAPIKLDLYQAKVTVGSRNLFPVSVKIKKGDSVAWINQDRSMHLIISDTGVPAFKGQGALAFSDLYLVTFDTSGSYTYHDQFNPSLKGTIVVE